MSASGRARIKDRGKPRRYRTDKTCNGKRRFVSEVEARAAAAVSLDERRDAERLWVYLCGHCSGWHITSRAHSTRYVVERVKP